MNQQTKPTAYFGWTDPDAKRSIEQKIGDALLRYEQKHGVKASLVIVHPSQVVEVQGVIIRAGQVKQNVFLVGKE